MPSYLTSSVLTKLQPHRCSALPVTTVQSAPCWQGFGLHGFALVFVKKARLDGASNPKEAGKQTGMTLVKMTSKHTILIGHDAAARKQKGKLELHLELLSWGNFARGHQKNCLPQNEGELSFFCATHSGEHLKKKKETFVVNFPKKGQHTSSSREFFHHCVLFEPSSRTMLYVLRGSGHHIQNLSEHYSCLPKQTTCLGWEFSKLFVQNEVTTGIFLVCSTMA